jgi:hypothetical protein
MDACELTHAVGPTHCMPGAASMPDAKFRRPGMRQLHSPAAAGKSAEASMSPGTPIAHGTFGRRPAEAL